tara:strand:+ start:330 stop:767 length:438 start_codon:yes stop_codon:yes gene_type:complete
MSIVALKSKLNGVIQVFAIETPRLIKCMKKYCAKDQVHKIGEVLKKITVLRRMLKQLERDLMHSDRAISSIKTMINLLDSLISIHKILSDPRLIDQETFVKCLPKLKRLEKQMNPKKLIGLRKSIVKHKKTLMKKSPKPNVTRKN